MTPSLKRRNGKVVKWPVSCTHTHKHSLPWEGESFFSGAGIRNQNAVRFKAGMNNTEKAPEIAAAEKGKDVVSVSTAVASLTSSSLAGVRAE